MWTIRDHVRMGICAVLIVVTIGCVNARAVVPYTLPPDLAKAETVQSEKQEILKRIENLKKLDISAIREIRDDLNQMEEKDSDSLPKKRAPEERH
jgi:hypothetical protein